MERRGRSDGKVDIVVFIVVEEGSSAVALRLPRFSFAVHLENK